MNIQVHETTHPLVTHKISLLRCRNTSVKEFRELIAEITLLIGYEATRELATEERPVSTPMENTTGRFISREVALVPVLRAGLGMTDALMNLIPTARVGHIGLYRDHDTLQPVEYYCKLPSDIASRQVLVLDPMLATGGSAAAAVTAIKQRGARHIKFLCVIAAPEGIAALTSAHPDIEIFCAAIDRGLNPDGYILPGLGDAGDRLFGTL